MDKDSKCFNLLLALNLSFSNHFNRGRRKITRICIKERRKN